MEVALAMMSPIEYSISKMKSIDLNPTSSSENEVSFSLKCKYGNNEVTVNYELSTVTNIESAGNALVYSIPVGMLDLRFEQCSNIELNQATDTVFSLFSEIKKGKVSVELSSLGPLKKIHIRAKSLSGNNANKNTKLFKKNRLYLLEEAQS